MDDLAIVGSFLQEAPVDIAELIKKLGIRYLILPLSDTQSGKIEHAGGKYTITINANDGPQRQRFTAAHELAHFLLHRDLLKDHGHLDRLFENGGNSNPSAPFSPAHEVQANRLAAQLLMPKNDVLATWGETHDVDAIARRFHVSKPAAEIRLKTLGALPN